MKLFQPDSRQRRTLGALFAISFILSILLTAFFNTQVVRGSEFKARSENNRLRPVVIPAPRGTMYDRYGEVVATSIPGFSVALLPGTKEVIQRTLADLQPFLGLAQSDIEELLAKRDARPNDLLTVTDDATFSQVAALEERRTSFPNLLIVDRPKRYYPAGPALGHLVGYVSEITREELQKKEFAERGYTQGRWVGKAGLEKEYEFRLAGSDGARFVEVDALGRIVNPRSTVEVQAPTPGKDLHLTLDLGLQKYLREIFPDTMAGAIAVMEPGTGEVLALYSNPTYDPNDFVGGIPSTLWRALRSDPEKPLLDRTINGLYPPGSTFKLATAAIALEKGVVKPEDHMPIPCTGGMAYAGRYARCWDHSGHGYLDLAGAIEKSCDVYFYQLGIRIGFADFAREGTRMGFSSRTGVDLPSESRNIFPTQPVKEFWIERFGNPPMANEIMPLAIGQGPNSQSVLSMATFYSALAAGNGRTYPPHLLEGLVDEKDVLDLQISEASLRAMWEGLGRVTEPGGTAYLSALGRWKLYGKTGTAQNSHGADHGWFAGFAGPRGGPPEVVAVVIVEFGQHGSDVAPLVSKAAEYYLDKKHHLPIDTQPTLIERWNEQRCPWGINCIPGESPARDMDAKARARNPGAGATQVVE
jgi:penicillin-binding protein 2